MSRVSRLHSSPPGKHWDLVVYRVDQSRVTPTTIIFGLDTLTQIYLFETFSWLGGGRGGEVYTTLEDCSTGKNFGNEWLTYSLQISYVSTFIYIESFSFESRSQLQW